MGSRIFLAILKEIILIGKGGELKRTLYPGTLADGTYLQYDEEEFRTAIQENMLNVLRKMKQEKRFYSRLTEEDIALAFQIAFDRKVNELKHMTVRLP